MNTPINKNFISALLVLAFLLPLAAWRTTEKTTIAPGRQPVLTHDVKGVIRVVFGRNDSIFYVTSKDGGVDFSTEQLVAHVPKMHLGMSRGPQLASSNKYSVVTAIDKEGAIHWFLLNHKSGKWINKGVVNDKPGSAPEGLMGLASDNNDNFYAVWLDIRLKKTNNIYFSSLSANKGNWSANKLIYRSPDGHTCECCKPNIAVKGNHVAVMFRNWLNGSRDLYYSESNNSGKTFNNVEKLGKDTWKLNGCPMDGGGISVDDKNAIQTAWRREGTVYYAVPKSSEVTIGKGRNCSIASEKGRIICSYQEGDDLKIADIDQNKQLVVGKGAYLKSTVLADKSILCVWEDDNKIIYRKI